MSCRLAHAVAGCFRRVSVACMESSAAESVVTPPHPGLRMPVARWLPRYMSPRRRLTRDSALRSFAKHWALVPEHREAMIADPPRHGYITDRWHPWHRWNLVRVAAVVHALCDRDGIDVPDWVHKHRAPNHIRVSWGAFSVLGAPDQADPRSEKRYSDAPEACNYHRAWFDQAFIEDIRVHGFRPMV